MITRTQARSTRDAPREMCSGPGSVVLALPDSGQEHARVRIDLGLNTDIILGEEGSGIIE